MKLLLEIPDVSSNGSEGVKLRLGGMALRNGLLVHGPSHWAVAVRTREGEIKVASGDKPRLKGMLSELPWVRGVARLGEAFAVIPLVKRALPEAQLPMQDGRTLGAMAGAAAAGQALRASGPRTVARELAVAGVSLFPALLALRGGDLASYHGVEHKAIAGYEQDKDASDAAKEHERCGSNLVAPMLISTVVGNALARRLLGARGPIASAAVTIGSAAIAVELLAWSERHRGTPLANVLKLPGNEIQRLFATREPTDEQLDVGRVALAEILRVEGGVPLR